ncbi:cytochrome c oxidase assembly protein ctaG-like isoform X1 [Branchiostoma lanceolatum]|uniref:cytochrome c oxidase assembly protein ctaG-like isoform X1 n=1 Tax=Branchiostoma lanceolatum TaxID=7740 RepID=UPI003455813B
MIGCQGRIALLCIKKPVLTKSTWNGHNMMTIIRQTALKASSWTVFGCYSSHRADVASNTNQLLGVTRPYLQTRLLKTGRIQDDWRQKNKSLMMYIGGIGVLVAGLAYACVPLYRMFCQATGLGGTVKHGSETVAQMKPVEDRELEIRFSADTAASMRWNFRPRQSAIKLVPGETALAFYTARNPTDQPIIGISTYNVVPFEAGQYFNKIQCFCFEEQRLEPNEEVDMPVFFFIDPEFAEDPAMYKVDAITLSYTFFEAKDGLRLPLPGYS